jgi:tetratricopeptide (TPR) repeat protein
MSHAWRRRLNAWLSAPGDGRKRRALLAGPVTVDALTGDPSPPGTAEAVALARALLADGRTAEALAWARHLTDPPGDEEPVAVALLMADCLVAQGAFEAAHPWFLRVAQTPDSAGFGAGERLRARGRAAHCLAEAGAWAEAAHHFETAIEALKTTPLPDRTALRTTFHVRAALCLAELGRADAALRHYLQAADRAEAALHGELDPGDALDCLLGAGELALRVNEIDRAEAAFERAARLATHFDARVPGPVRRRRIETGLGLCAVERGRWDEAARRFRRALAGRSPPGESSVTRAATALQLAEAEARRGRAGPARAAFEHALALHAAEAPVTPVHFAERALAHQLFGTFLMSVDEPATAELQYRAAVDAWRAITEPDRVDARLLSLSEHQLGACLALRGETRGAARHFRAAIVAARAADALGRVDPHSLAVSLSQLGTVLLDAADADGAEAAFAEAAALFGRPAADGTTAGEALGAALHGQAACHLMRGELDTARTLLEHAIAAKAAPRPDGPPDATSLGATRLLLAQTLASLDDPDADTAYEHAAATLDAAGKTGPSPLRALAHHAIGSRRFVRGDYDAAIAAYAASAVAKGYTGPGGMSPDIDHLSVTLHELAGCHLARGDAGAARRGYIEAARIAGHGDESGRVDHDSVGTSLHQVGHCYTLEGDDEAARTWFERAVEEKRQGDREGRVSASSLGTSLQAVGYCLLEAGRRGEALLWFRRALNEKKRGDQDGVVDQAAVGSAHHQIAFTLASEGRLEEAIEEFRRATEAKARGDAQGRVDHESLGASLHLLGDCHLELHRPDEALAWYERAVEAALQGDVLGRIDHESLGLSLHQAGFAAFACERADDAIRYFERAAEAKAQGNLQGRVDHDSLGTTWHELGFCRVRAERYDDARDFFEKAAEAKQAGNARGRVDQLGVARCLLRAAECAGAVDAHWEARMIQERALKAARTAEAEYGAEGKGDGKAPQLSALLAEIDDARRRTRRALTGGG